MSINIVNLNRVGPFTSFFVFLPLLFGYEDAAMRRVRHATHMVHHQHYYQYHNQHHLAVM